MFEKRFRGESVIFQVTEKAVIDFLKGYYEDVRLIIQTMKDNPEFWAVKTDYSDFRWSETGNYAIVKVRMNGG